MKTEAQFGIVFALRYMSVTVASITSQQKDSPGARSLEAI
jgi:hypothetical protein